MKLLGLFKPEYCYQPHKLLQRLQHRHLLTDEWIDVMLPWKMPIRVRAQEEHGRILTTLGVIDLPVTETLWRLTDSGECAVDVGANLGYMTALLAARVASSGKVYAFEAHPGVYSELEYNIKQWQNPQIKGYAIAVSNHSDEVTLAIDSAFTINRGLATVVSDVATLDRSSRLLVKATTLDTHFSDTEQIHVLKVDVEGHELQVFQGAKTLLQEKRIRDCVFEEHRAYPTPVTDLLEAHDYQIWRIDRQFWKPALVDPASVSRINWLPTSFLATCDPERARQRLQGNGWQCLTTERRQP